MRSDSLPALPWQSLGPSASIPAGLSERDYLNGGGSVSEREKLEQELENCEAEKKDAGRKKDAAAMEAQKFARTKPLPPLETPEQSEPGADMWAAFKRRDETDTEYWRLSRECDRLRKELDRYR